jgi:lysine-N-methylase
LRKTKLIRLQYAENFRCIGASCEDTCCAGWNVSIDQATYEKYQTIPTGPLRILIDKHVHRLPDKADGSKPDSFASIEMSSSLACPMHNADRLCQIQVQHGAGYLSATCSTFPRQSRTIDDFKETTLTLSCPEAARMVLTNPYLLAYDGHQTHYLNWDDEPRNQVPLREFFWPIREFTAALLRNRSYPLWQRMFLLGSFCRRLEAVVSDQVEGGYPALESGFSKAISSGSLRASIETIHANNALQLDMVLQLLNLRASDVVRSARFDECRDAFVHGISHGGALTLEEQSVEYASAYERFYAPFFLKHPYMLENLLVNMIVGRIFPFGDLLFAVDGVPEPARQFALLATEFALIKGLLIGVAGYHQEAFSVEHVVQTVQVVAKTFEHNASFVPWCLQLLASKGLDNAHGLTMLLRN